LSSTAKSFAANDPNGVVSVARLSLTGGGPLLQKAASDPALDVKYRNAAPTLANAYQPQSAIRTTASPEQYQAETDSAPLKSAGYDRPAP
jgi:hypothetical protein